MPGHPPQSASRSPLSVHCERIVREGSLDAKLAPPPGPADAAVRDARADAPLAIDAPGRDTELAFAPGSERLPKPGQLRSADARIVCLARFAHHELMAVELFAWALLRWPELPDELRVEWVRVMADEQRHCRLYLDRLAAHGSSLEEHPQASYFWRHVPEITAAPNPPLAFLAAMGLTLEQANLDFTRLYADAFREAGDEESARVCEQVHRDEIRHVEVAARWLRELDPSTPDEAERYERHVPAPLGPARAKGRRFEREARRRAGLGEAFIEYVRTARSPQELRGRPARDERTPG